MPETQQTTQDASGVTRTPEGTIASQPRTDTPPSTSQTTSTEPKSKPTTAQQTDSTKETKPEGSFLTETEGDKPKAETKEGEAKPGAPEKYEDFKVPEGFELDKDLLDEVTPIFRKNGLSQEAAQELIDFYGKNIKEAIDAPYETYRETRKTWRSQIQADPEIGGRMGEVKASIGRLIDSFGNESVAAGFRRAMDLTGAGDNPDVVRGLYALSKLVTEGHVVRGNGPSPEGQRPPGSPSQPTAAQAIYPHLKSTG